MLDKGDVHKLLNNRTYVGEVVHKGQVFPGQHEAIVSRALWDAVHALLGESAGVRGNRHRAQTPALLKGLIFGVDGRALSPTHTRRRGRLYRYYVAQRLLKGQEAGDDLVARVSAAEIETAVVDQVRALLRQPEVVVGTWMVARAEWPDLTEVEVRDALCLLDPLWSELSRPSRRASSGCWWSESRSGRAGRTSVRVRADPALVKTLARAFRWQKLLDEGRYGSISELARAERIERGYLGKVLRLALLAPNIVEAVLDGKMAEGLSLPGLLSRMPTMWTNRI